MKLLLESRHGKEFNKILENVEGYSELPNERKIYISYKDGKGEEFSMMQYMVVPQED